MKKVGMSDFTNCEDAVKDYLAQTNKDVLDMKAKKGDTVVVDYIGRLESGDVFDTSVEDVAKNCGKYQTGRNYDDHLAFTVGAGKMIPGFDAAVDGMAVGSTVTVTIPAKEAYGEVNNKLIFRQKKADLKDAHLYEVGQILMDKMGNKMKVVEVTDDEIVFDANHELAGKDLIFDITLLKIE